MEIRKYVEINQLQFDLNLYYMILNCWLRMQRWLFAGLSKRSHALIAELRRLKGTPSRAPYSYGKQEETHELIFSWLSWLAVLLVGGYALQRRRRRSRATWRPYSKQWVDWDMQPWFIVYFFDIGHPCYDQLTPVKTRYPLTSDTWPYRRLKFTAHRGQVFFEVYRWQSAGFFLQYKCFCCFVLCMWW